MAKEKSCFRYLFRYIGQSTKKLTDNHREPPSSYLYRELTSILRAKG